MKLKSLFQRRDNILYLVLFFVCLFALIIISVIVRTIHLVQHSTFSLNSFTVLILADKPYLVTVDRSLNQFSAVKWKTSSSSFSHNTMFGNSIALGVPIDGEIIQDQNNVYSTNVLSSYFTLSNIVGVLLTNTDLHFVGMDPLDLITFYWATKHVPNTNINQVSLAPQDANADTTVQSLFKDETIINEQESIEVINDTNISGLGSRVAQMLENGGYNVISVTSGDDLPHSKIIYRMNPDVTLKHLTHVIPFPVQYKNETSIADISVIIGEDYASLR